MKKCTLLCMAITMVMVTLQAQVTVSKTGPNDNLARNADTSESDPGWGGGSYKSDLVDGIRSYDGQWARGLAFPNGVWKQVTLNFGQEITFDRIIQWYHGGMNNNEAAAYRFQYWNGSDWVDFFETASPYDYLLYPNVPDTVWWYYWSTPYQNSFSPVTTSKLRIWNFPRAGSHTWLYEVEVYQGKQIIVPDQSVILGNTVELEINTSVLHQDENVISYQFDMSYDPQNLEFVETIIGGTLSESGSLITNTEVPGQLRFSFMSTSPLVNQGTLLKLKFNTLGEGAFYCGISNFLYNTTAVNNIQQGKIIVMENVPPVADIAYPHTGGYVQVGDSITIVAYFNEAMADTPVPQIMLNGANYLPATDMLKFSDTEYRYTHKVTEGFGVVKVSLANGTDIPGNVVVATPASGESFTIIRLGDVDDNTFIQAYDAALTLQYSVSLDPLPIIDPLPWEMWRYKTADVDKDDGITANDASLILKHSAGLLTHFGKDAPQYILKSEPADISIEWLNNELIFRTSVNLFGLNISVSENARMLGRPVVVDKNYISASNITESTYKIGLASPYAAAHAEVFLKIPVLEIIAGELLFDLIVNTKPMTVRVKIPTSLGGVYDNRMRIYPNPVSDILHLEGIYERSIVKVLDVTGRQMPVVQNTFNQIDVNSLANGVYLIMVSDESGTITRRFTKE